jgi:hypothetical protein
MSSGQAEMVARVHGPERDQSELLRTTGGLLFATGALVLLIRKSGTGGWSDLARVAVAFVPTALLYLLALSPARERARPSQSVLAVTAILLLPVLLFEFLHWVGASTRHLLYDAAVFALVGLLAAYAARRGRVAYASLLAGLSFVATWLFVWAKILNHPSANTFRWLLVAAAAVLLLIAWRMARAGAAGAGETATAGGIAAIAAGLFGVIVSSFIGTTQAITRTLGPGRVTESRTGGMQLHTSGMQHLGWDIYLVVAAVALTWLGSRVRARSLGYVGAVGLGAFIISTGVQITRLQSGRGPTHDVVVWPLVLLVLGAAALVVSALRTRDTL